MDSQANAYYINLLSGQTDLYHEFTTESLDQGSEYAPISSELESTTKKTRGGNFTVDEDMLLISAWLNISLDPVKGNQQKGKTYWQRVWEYFHEHKTCDSDRNHSSLMNRWSAIQLATNKFCGCFAQIMRKNQSGTTEKDKVRDVKKLYLVTHKSSFTFEHCWNELRYHPKWMEDVEIKQQKTQKPATPGVPSSAPTTVNLEATNETCDLEFVELDRPTGNKVGKEQEKQEKKENKRKKSDGGNDGTSATMVILDNIWVERRQMNDAKKEMMEKIYLQEQEKIQQTAEKIRMKKLKEDERIMSLDTSKMPPLQAEYIQRRQMEILGKQFKLLLLILVEV